MTEPFSNPAVLPSLLWAKTVDLLSSQVSFIALVLPSFRHFLGDYGKTSTASTTELTSDFTAPPWKVQKNI